MKPIYIIAIVVGAIFVVFLCLYILSYIKRRKTEAQMKEELDKTYTDPDIAKMEYDIAYYDEEIQGRINAMNQKTDQQVTIDEVIHSDTVTVSPPQEDALFAKIDDDGMEEISGNYNPNEHKD